MSRVAERDADDCAQHLCAVRLDTSWDRFDNGVDHYLRRHKHSVTVLALRRILADAYLTCAPEDSEGHQRIMGKS